MDVMDLDYQGEQIKLGKVGKVRHIKYTIKGLKILSKAFGSVVEAIEKIQTMNEKFDCETLDDICTFVYAGLIHEDSNLTVDQVENMMEFGDITNAMKPIMTAFNHSMPNQNEVSNDNQGELKSISTESNTLPV